MDAKSFDNTLAGLLVRIPYRPFTVLLKSGERVQVSDQYALAYRCGVAAYITSSGSPILFSNDDVSHMVADPAT